MRPSNRTRTLSFVAFASFAALTGCGRDASAEPSFADRIESAPLAAIDAHPLTRPADVTVPVSRVLRGSSAQLADGSARLTDGSAVTPIAARSGIGGLDLPAPAQPAVAENGALTLGLESPARAALAQSSESHDGALSLALASPARLALGDGPLQARSIASTPTLVVGTDLCETDDDCVPDGCHATSCVAADEMAPGELPGELQCTADFRYGTTDGGGCLCHVGHCAALLSTPPQGI